MKRTACEYVKSGDHLPAPLRDFHDQKDVFKTIHALSQSEHSSVTWIMGHIYVIDVFLWFMAKRGWTLQRSRANVDFRDLAADINLVRDRESETLKQLMSERKETP